MAQRKTAKHGDGGIMPWGLFTTAGTDEKIEEGLVEAAKNVANFFFYYYSFARP